MKMYLSLALAAALLSLASLVGCAGHAANTRGVTVTHGAQEAQTVAPVTQESPHFTFNQLMTVMVHLNQELTQRCGPTGDTRGCRSSCEIAEQIANDTFGYMLHSMTLKGYQREQLEQFIPAWTEEARGMCEPVLTNPNTSSP